jgi:hypothetical protein
MFLGLPDPDLLVRGPDLDPSVIKQISRKNLDSYFVTAEFVVAVLKVTDENSQIRIRIR